MGDPQLIKLSTDGCDNGRLWDPIVGPEATLLMERKRFASEPARKVLDESVAILSNCIPPQQPGDRAGIVIGYVQSGKTLSFTTVTALARDNGYRLVIVLAGTKTNLLDQNEERLTGDLGILEERSLFWRVMANPRNDSATVSEVQSALKKWERYPDRPERCRTLLVVVMKNATRLKNLRQLLERCDLANVTALIIDDEGDQAGLNTRVRQNAESPTYAMILGLRRALPSHTYVQYTATPQAPLLISRIDLLSPKFAQLLEPGEGYVGGRDLFGAGSPYVEQIPAADLPGVWDVSDGPPPSLERAMRLFFIGASAGVLNGREGNRTMMIHPSHLTSMHDTYAAWSKSIKDSWLATLAEPKTSPDHVDLRHAFEASYDDLKRTETDLQSFEVLWAELEFAIEETVVRVVNATNGRIPTFPWGDSYGYILVGGAGLDRGFTVEGLTVTYMPRGAGTGTADTIQQRARFFGYKGSYKGLVRIFVDVAVEDAFTAYVEHEESLRKSLMRHAGQPLVNWKRAFFLDLSLQPTRRSVMALETMRGRSKEWVYAAYVYDPDTDLADRNRAVVDTFTTNIRNVMAAMPGSAAWTSNQQHLKAGPLRLDVAYERLLVPLIVEDDDDALDHLNAMMQIREELDRNPNAACDVYLMGGGERRERATRLSGEVENPFQGANPGNGYPGDRKIRSEDRVTLQIHHLDLTQAKAPLASDVRLVAISIPERMRRDLLLQVDD